MRTDSLTAPTCYRKRLAGLPRLTLLCGTLVLGLGLVAGTASAQTATCRKEPCARPDTSSRSATFGAIQVSTAGRGLPASASGLAGGPVDAPTEVNSMCIGFVGELPDHLLTLAQTIPRLQVAVTSAGDTTLLIHGPSGWTCSDDAEGFNPAIEGEFPAGTYRIWVGSYQMGEYHDYSLSVQSVSLPSVPSPVAVTTGALDATSSVSVGSRADAGQSELMSGVVLTGRAQGDVQSSYLAATSTGACDGLTTQEPSHIVNLTMARATITMALQHRSALGLAIHGPNGWMCAPPDINAALTSTLDPGTYRIWVTAEGRTGQREDYSLNLLWGTATTPAVVPAPPPMLSVRGNFEGLDIFFSGQSVDELHTACTAFAGSSDSLDWVDDIVLHGVSYRNASRYWDASALCALVALNARPEGASASTASVAGNLEGAPFEVHGTSEQVRSVLTRYLGSAVDMAWADDLVVNGQTRRNSSGYWNAAEVVMLILSLAR